MFIRIAYEEINNDLRIILYKQNIFLPPLSLPDIEIWERGPGGESIKYSYLMSQESTKS
jgi:hypothetical protein